MKFKQENAVVSSSDTIDKSNLPFLFVAFDKPINRPFCFDSRFRIGDANLPQHLIRARINFVLQFLKD